MKTWLLTLYKLMLWLYPRRFHAAFGAEMADVFAEKLAQAEGKRALLAAFGRELRHWPGSLLREHWDAQQASFDLPVYKKLSQRGAVVAILPYLLMALIFAASALFGAQTAVQNILFGASLLFLLAAWWQRWPAWSASWLGFLTFFVAYILLSQFISPTQSGITATEYFWRMMFGELLYVLPLFCIFYWLVGRWPQVGAIVLLPPLGFSWLLNMEFVPENITTAIFVFTWLWLAMMVVLFGRKVPQRQHAWGLGVAALVIGLLSAYAGQFWVSFPGDFIPANGGSLSNVMESFLAAFVPTLLPLVAILLLHTLRRKLLVGNGRSTLRPYRLFFLSMVGFIGLMLIAQRLFLPSDLAAFRSSGGVVLTAVALLSLLGIGWSAWQMGRARPGWLLLLLALLFPFLFQAESIALLLGELPVFVLPNKYLLYETVRLGGRTISLIWLVLAAWLLSRTPAQPEELQDEAVLIATS